LNDFVIESNTKQTIRTKSEIFYNSGGTKIETRDADGNCLQRNDSMSGDHALNNICSLIQDVNIPNTE